MRRIAAAVACPIQVGGGLRDADAVAAVLAAGADRLVIGTAALRDPEFLDRALAEHGERVVVSVDARAGKVSLAGWTEATERDAAETVAALAARGVARFLCTEIDVDGTMEGPAIGELGRIWRRPRSTARLPRPTTVASACASPSCSTRSHTFSKKLPLPLSTPMRAGTWPIMIVSARPMMKPLSTGSEMNAARKPRRSTPASSAARPVASARPAVRTTNSPASSVIVETTPRDSAAVADIGDTTR